MEFLLGALTFIGAVTAAIVFVLTVGKIVDGGIAIYDAVQASKGLQRRVKDLESKVFPPLDYNTIPTVSNYYSGASAYSYGDFMRGCEGFSCKDECCKKPAKKTRKRAA